MLITDIQNLKWGSLGPQRTQTNISWKNIPERDVFQRNQLFLGLFSANHIKTFKRRSTAQTGLVTQQDKSVEKKNLHKN